MSDRSYSNSIEIMGQKFCYPTTWQGASSVLVVCTCISFLGHTLTAEEINSYAGIFNTKSEEAYSESLSTIAELNQQIESMHTTIGGLAKKAKLDDAEKQAVSANLESDRQVRQQALASLGKLQTARITELQKSKDELEPGQIVAKNKIYSVQQDKISNIQEQTRTYTAF